MSGKITSTSLLDLCSKFGVASKKLSDLRSKSLWTVTGSGRTATFVDSTTPATGNIAVNSTFINKYYLNPRPTTLNYTSSQSVVVPASKPTPTLYDLTLKSGGGGGGSGAGGYTNTVFDSRGGGGGGGGASGGVLSWQESWAVRPITWITIGGGGAGGAGTGSESGNFGNDGGSSSVDNGTTVWYIVTGGGRGGNGVNRLGGSGGIAPIGGMFGLMGFFAGAGNGGAGGAGGSFSGVASGGAGGAGGNGNWPSASTPSASGGAGSNGSGSITFYYV